MARAVAIDPRILILDDSLSAVDTYTEEEILLRLRGVMRERTSIIVSHRISTVRDADQILVLDAGRIVERGTHDCAGPAERRLRGAAQEAAARRGAGGIVSTTLNAETAEIAEPQGMLKATHALCVLSVLCVPSA